jgi:tetratricopeptide (TPR) repeat protein
VVYILTGRTFAVSIYIMKKISLSILSVLVLFFISAGLKASDQADRAVEHYQNEEYEKALELIEPVFRANPTSMHLYNYYFNSMVQLEKYDRAISELQSLVRRYPETPRFGVDLGYVYQRSGKEREAKDQFDKVIKNLPNDEDRIKATGNAFQRRGLTGRSIEAYETGRKIRGDNKAFMYQLADLYRNTGRYSDMIDEYLQILEENREYKTNVQNNIQELVMENEEVFEEVRRKLIRKVQQMPSEVIFTDLLSWLFIQKEDYHEAFRQLRAVDRRMEEEGKRMFDLAAVATANRAYDVAEEIYRYVTSVGEDGRFFLQARQGLLEVKYLRLTEGMVPPDEVDQIARAYHDHVETFGYRFRGASDIFLRLAEIKALYQDKPEEAIELLEDFIVRGRGNDQVIAHAKLAQARYYTFLGKTWRATLLYGQVDKDFKDHPIGHEARYRNARLSFYRGEFEWARAQLEILKGATSDLIANDALQLSLIIKDAIGLDTTTHPLELFAEADLLIFRRHFDRAEELLNELMNTYPGHTLTDNALMAKAEIRMQNRDFEGAFAFYEEVYSNYKDGIVVDEALYKAARLQLDRFDDTAKAIELFEELIFEYPDSYFTVDARREYRALRGSLP